MASIFWTMRQLKKLRRAEREAALAATLPVASSDERDAIAAELLDLAGAGRIVAADALLRGWFELTVTAKRAAGSVLAPMVEARVCNFARSHEPQDRLLAASLVMEVIQGRFKGGEDLVVPMLRVVGDLVSDDEQSIRIAAVRSLAQISRSVSLANPAFFLMLDAALAAAARGYSDHRETSILPVLARVVTNAGPALQSWLESVDEGGQMALRGALKTMEITDPAQLVEWLATPTLAGEAVRRLEQVTEKGELEAILAAGVLLRVGGRKKSLRKMRHTQRLIPASGQLSGLSEAARLGAFEWLDLKAIKDDHRLAVASSLLADPSDAVRMRAVRCVSRIGASRGRTTALFEFALDRCEAIGMAALSAMIDTPSSHHRAACAEGLSLLKRSPHKKIRRLASRTLEAFDPTRNLSQAIRKLRVERAGFIDALRARMVKAHGDEATRLITMVTRLELVTEFETELIRMAGEDDTRVAAKAALALGRAKSVESAAALMDAVEHEDDRVRADAVEALAARKSRVNFERFAQDPTARVRANAIAAMYAKGENASARRVLSDMLRDERMEHRRSGLWAAERSGDSDLAAPVALLLEKEDEESLRRRAARTARRMVGTVRRVGVGRTAKDVRATG